MDQQQWSLRVGASVILCALVLRLCSGGYFQPLVDFLEKPNIASFLIYLETGRNVRFSQSQGKEVFAVESPEPDLSEWAELPEQLPAFFPKDAASVEVKYGCSLRPDLETLMAQALTWDLTAEEPAVLILHTHATESYTKQPGEDYEESGAFRTLDESYNMISVGDYLAELLEAGGLTVLHDRQLHDYPSYNGSYSHARKSMEAYLEEYPSIQLVLDLHRDASGDNSNQMVTEATVDGADSAQIMLVVGTDASGLKHPDWEENLSLALKLHLQMERINPGICRYVNLRSQRFNQDLCPGALIVEVGAAGNSHEEALRATKVLAKGILNLAKGSSVS